MVRLTLLRKPLTAPHKVLVTDRLPKSILPNPRYLTNSPTILHILALLALNTKLNIPLRNKGHHNNLSHLLGINRHKVSANLLMLQALLLAPLVVHHLLIPHRPMVAFLTDHRVSHLRRAFVNGHRSELAFLSLPTRCNKCTRARRLLTTLQVAGVALDGMVKIRIQLCHQFLLLKVMVVVIRLTLRLMIWFQVLLERLMTLTRSSEWPRQVLNLLRKAKFLNHLLPLFSLLKQPLLLCQKLPKIPK